MKEYILDTTYIPLTATINGFSNDKSVIRFFNTFDKETLLGLLDTQIETENYEICPLIHKALNNKI